MPNAIVSTIRHELREMLPPTLFFLIAFNLLALTVTLVSETAGIDPVTHAAASIGALIVGKSVLIADHLPFVNRYPERPLIWNTVWKAAIYFMVTAAVRVAEALISAATDAYGFRAGLAHEVATIDWGRFWAVQLWLAVLFLVYTAFRELSRAVGRGRVGAMFFGPLPAPPEPA
jgi:hypothetical protein